MSFNSNHNMSPCGRPSRPRLTFGELNYSAEQINELLKLIPQKADRDEIPERITSYNALKDCPSINYKKLAGNMSSEDLGLVSEKRMLDVTDRLAIECYRTKKIAQTAIDAIKTLQGLSDATEAAKILAGLVAQIESNTSDIASIRGNTVYLSKKEYKELVDSGTYDPDTEYNVFEDEEEDEQ